MAEYGLKKLSAKWQIIGQGWRRTWTPAITSSGKFCACARSEIAVGVERFESTCTLNSQSEPHRAKLPLTQTFHLLASCSDVINVIHLLMRPKNCTNVKQRHCPHPQRRQWRHLHLFHHSRRLSCYFQDERPAQRRTLPSYVSV